jgi:hypothetical protein
MKPERTETTNNFNYGFTISEDELRRINTILTQQMKIAAINGKFVTVFRLQFKNLITGERNSVDQVLAESNAGQWKIKSLEIELYDEDVPSTQILLTVVPPWDWTAGKVKTSVYTIGKKGVQNGTTTEIYSGVQSTSCP